jgi:endoglucanase
VSSVTPRSKHIGTHRKAGRRERLAIVLGAGLALAVLATSLAARPGVAARAAASTGTVLSLSVHGNHFTNALGQTVQLRGVDRSSFVSYCSDGYGFAQGPVTQAGVNAIHAWHVNMIRLQLNEDCWLGINGMPARYSGIHYRNAIADYVRYANKDGMYVVLSLAWNAPGTRKSLQQEPMADQSHAPAFWNSVAARFKHNDAVLFDLYNEPRPDYAADSTAAYRCILRGGTCAGVSYAAAGMQELVNDVRRDGASNVLLIGGPNSAERLDQWLKYKPHDPLGRLAASVHVYNASPDNSLATWNSDIAPVARKVPVVTGEMGQDPLKIGGCQYAFSRAYTTWADQHGVSYAAFDWDTWPQCDALITTYQGKPTAPYGTGWKAHFAARARAVS